jgi:hypothetical protein
MPEPSASALIDAKIASLKDWRGDALSRVRALIHETDPAIVEQVKWRGVPVWSQGGIVCTGETYKTAVKLTFPKGAQLPDPAGLFNASLEGNARRAIDIHEGDKLDARAFKALVKAAIAANAKPKAKTKTKSVKLLSGGNPQIAKAGGDAPVAAYIAAMPGWKRALGERLDALIVANAPGVKKAVRWNSPFYGMPDKGWFVTFHVLTRYVKVTFFDGLALKPVPPGGTAKSGQARWIDIYEDDGLNEARMARWVKQAMKLPGWRP